MKNPFVLLFRYCSLQRNKSTVPHAIRALDEAKSVVVVLDPLALPADLSKAEEDIRAFFASKHIETTVLCPKKENVNWGGFIKRKIRAPKGKLRNEDVFISLASTDVCYAAEYEARCSPAKFKVGINNTKWELFDMIVTPPADKKASQMTLFSAIKQYISTIQ